MFTKAKYLKYLPLVLIVFSCNSLVDHSHPSIFRIAFVAWNDHILSIMSDGSNYKLLAGPSLNLNYPLFSPDGSQILFKGYSNSSNIMLVDTSGGPPVIITDTPESEWPNSFFPSGDRIIFNRHNYLWTMKLDGSEETSLTPGFVSLGGEYSAATQRIYFVSNMDGNFEAYSMNTDGSQRVNLTNNGGEDKSISLSRDGGLLTFVSNRTGNNDVFLLNLHTNQLTNVTIVEMLAISQIIVITFLATDVNEKDILQDIVMQQLMKMEI